MLWDYLFSSSCHLQMSTNYVCLIHLLLYQKENPSQWRVQIFRSVACKWDEENERMQQGVVVMTKHWTQFENFLGWSVIISGKWTNLIDSRCHSKNENIKVRNETHFAAFTVKLLRLFYLFSVRAEFWRFVLSRCSVFHRPFCLKLGKPKTKRNIFWKNSHTPRQPTANSKRGKSEIS